MSRALARLAAAALFALLATAARAEETAPRRSWEVDGIRLEPDQVERLADDMATRTVAAVQQKVAGIELSAPQLERMRGIYREVALDVFAEVVKEVARTDLSDADKEARIRELVLAGQRRSHTALEGVLDPRQLELYSAWEQQQVAAFQSRRLDARRRKR